MPIGKIVEYDLGHCAWMIGSFPRGFTDALPCNPIFTYTYQSDKEKEIELKCYFNGSCKK